MSAGWMGTGMVAAGTGMILKLVLVIGVGMRLRVVGMGTNICPHAAL